jgi:two-component system sensor histidine kinase UhpB
VGNTGVLRERPEADVSLSVRLNVAIAGLLLLLLLAATATIVVNARSAVAREIESSVNLTLGLLTATTAAADAAGQGALRGALVESLGRLHQIRHLDIALVGPDGLPLLPVGQGRVLAPARAPRWFVALVRPTTVEYRHRIGTPTGPYTEIAVRPNPADEITEAWEQSRVDLALLLAFAGITMLLISLTVSHAFRPVEHMIGILATIQRGDYSARMDEPRLPELQRIAHEVNRIAEQLQAQDRENRALRRRALVIQEAERQGLARELHDELGQAISAIKALAVSLGQHGRGEQEARERAATIAAICDDLYAAVRQMMKRLRPVVLDQLGLATALRRAVDEWNEHHTGAVCTLELGEGLEEPEEGVRIQIYRIVQEALTNVARHGHATRVGVRLDRAPGEEGALRLEIDDDGVGFGPERLHCGLGLRGMQERAQSMGGQLCLDSAPGRGTRIRAVLPRVAGEAASVAGVLAP